jgi:hypothetical protein
MISILFYLSLVLSVLAVVLLVAGLRTGSLLLFVPSWLWLLTWVTACVFFNLGAELREIDLRAQYQLVPLEARKP